MAMGGHTDVRGDAVPVKPVTLDGNGAWESLVQLLQHQQENLLVASERTRSALAQLSALSLCALANQGDKADIEEITNKAEIADVLDKVTLLASREILVMHPMSASREGLADGVARNRAARERGVAIRTIYQAPVSDSARILAHLRRLGRVGVQVRRAPLIPFCLVVVDESLALVSSPEPVEAVTHLLLIRRSAVVRLLRRVFEFCWDSTTEFLPATSEAVPAVDDAVGQVPEPGAEPVRPELVPVPALVGPIPRLSGQQLVVLRLWASGRPDTMIARELQVSSRTLRRIISTLLRRLGVSTRFEAGMVAARMQGLLDAPRLPARSG